MASIDIANGTSIPRGGHKGLVLSFCFAIFLSASLLFSVQPLFTKLILPLLGGSANVWNTAMVFFQAMLLGGYIYAWAVSKYLPFRAQIAVHLVVTAIGFIFLPLAVAQGWTPPQGAMPTAWLLGLFGVSVGMPFFALSANAPLLQRWFSYTDHPDAADPYFLYSVSNAGSLIVLCAYPVLIEPFVELTGQTRAWSFGYYGLWAALLIAGGYALTRLDLSSSAAADKADDTAAPLGLRRIALWTALAFIPSSLMLGVTTYVSSSIASAPFLWIVPLVLYLLTFIIAFGGHRRVTSQRLALPAILSVVAAMMSLLHIGPQVLRICVQIGAVFMISLYMHVRLVEDRPQAAHLTKFYIFMSLGGVLGGAFNALAAPLIFNKVLEYPLVLLASLAMVGMALSWTRAGRNYRLAIVAVAASAAVAIYLAKIHDAYEIAVLVFMAGLLTAAGALRMNVRLRLPGCVAIGAFLLWAGANQNAVFKDRSFFSTLTVVQAEDEQGKIVHDFIHGDTVHNIQLRDPDLQAVPLAYYGDGNTFDLALQAARTGKSDISAVVIGLGAGALACQENAGETWRYLEIDPAVVEMARNPELFSFIDSCSPNADIRVGDARLTMQALTDNSQDIIIVDAFTSNAIPAHLLTREAIRIYTSKLADDGVIFFHTSNRMLDVESVVIRTAEAEGLASRHILLSEFDQPHAEHYKPSSGVLVGPAERIAEVTKDSDVWREMVASDRVKPWSDDYSSIIGPFLARRLDH